MGCEGAQDAMDSGDVRFRSIEILGSRAMGHISLERRESSHAHPLPNPKQYESNVRNLETYPLLQDSNTNEGVDRVMVDRYEWTCPNSITTQIDAIDPRTTAALRTQRDRTQGSALAPRPLSQTERRVSCEECLL